VQIKDADGYLLDTAIPKVAIVKDGTFHADDFDLDPEREVDLTAIIDYHHKHAPLSGFVIEGLSPYGFMTSRTRHLMMRKAALMGMPVVRVGRGNNDGFSPPRDVFLGGRNLTATKARLLLMACLMRHGALPPARDPDKPTDAEMRALRSKLDAYQAIFDTH
jgi:L-asparaginase